jgi:primase-polymerase (primpol)-like protein
MRIEQPLHCVDPGKEHEILGIQTGHIPQELKTYTQWVCWRYMDRGEGRKPDKQPVNPRSLANAGVHWTNTWTAFEIAYATYLQYRSTGIYGIGFVLTPTDPYVAIDLDSCVQEDEIESKAGQVIHDLGSYTELSPSGHGIHILVACPEFQDNVRRQDIEVYSHSRYVTFTGHHIAGTPREISVVSPDLITSLLPAAPEQVFASSTQAAKPVAYPASDMELWERIFAHDKYGRDHLRRFQGDSSLDRNDHSFTIIRLLNCLARWTQCDPSRMRTMILMSPLANDKWLEKRGAGNWLDYQIADALVYVSRKAKK